MPGVRRVRREQARAKHARKKLDDPRSDSRRAASVTFTRSRSDARARAIAAHAREKPARTRGPRFTRTIIHIETRYTYIATR